MKELFQMAVTDFAKEGWKTYLITVETTILLSLLTAMAFGYNNLVTKEELGNRSPYIADKAIILQHIADSKISLRELNIGLQKTNAKLDLEINRLHIALVQAEAKINMNTDARKQGR